MAEAEQTFTHVSEILRRDDRVSESTVFGSECLAIGHKAFVIFYRDNLVVRLRSDRARELIESHEGYKFDPLESGWALEGWVRLVPDYGRQERLWVSLAEEARDYALATADPDDIRSASVVVDGGEAVAAMQAPEQGFEEVVLQPTQMRSFSDFDLGQQPTAERPVMEPVQPTTVSKVPEPEPERSPGEVLSLEFSPEELEQLGALALLVDQDTDERVRSALEKVQSALQSHRAIGAVRDQLATAGLDTGHLSDAEVIALGQRISQSSPPSEA